MQMQSRIPKLTETSFEGALLWFSELQVQKLMFHPEDDPADVRINSNGLPTFTNSEVAELRFLMGELESCLGYEQVIEAAYPIFKNVCSLPLDA
ncbi:MAG: hypothetical protein SFU55_08345 [Methylophilus sp.]|nr:hypothetical protein [Methylophilus sp.]